MKYFDLDGHLADLIQMVFEPLHLQEDSTELRHFVVDEVSQVLSEAKKAGALKNFSVTCLDEKNIETGKLTVTVAYQNREGRRFCGDFTGTIAMTTLPGVDTGTIYSVTAAPLSAQLPEFTFHGIDENGQDVRLNLKPETNITPYELTQIMLLLFSFSFSRHQPFDTYNFVKNHNLERHFHLER